MTAREGSTQADPAAGATPATEPAGEAFDPLTSAVSVSRRVVVGRIGGFGGLFVGALVLELALVSHAPAYDRWATAAAALVALAAGTVLTVMPRRVPIWSMDVLAASAAVLLVVIGHYSSTLQPALPGIYVLIGTNVFAVRSRRTAILHTASLGLSYAGVLLVGPPHFAPVTRWFVVMAAVITSGVFLRWLVTTAGRLAAKEHAAWREAEAASEALAETSRAKSAFLARMSHELRTPLNVVLGFADLLSEQLVGPLSARQRDYVADIGESARHLVSLVDDVLDPVKVERGDVDLDIGPVDAYAVVTESARMVRSRADAGGVELRLDVARELGTAHIDGRRVRQVVVNLLANAVKFTPRGGHVVLTARRVGHRLFVAVEDTGIGIAAGDLDRIFEEFQQSGHTGEGTGLGLPLARRFIEAHGGRLWAVSAPGRGSTFSFELPCRPKQPLAVEPRVPADPEVDEHAAITEPGSPANRLLVARVGSWLAVVAAVICLVSAAITPVPLHLRLALAGLGAASLLSTLAIRRWSPLLPARGVEAIGALGIVAITVATAFGGRFADLIPLAYGWITMTTFALWVRRSAVAHLVAIAACYCTVLVVAPSEHPLRQGLAVLNVLTVNAFIASWMTERLRALVAAEQATRRHAEQIRAELDRTSKHKSAFLANMSHELRTPLNAVIGFAELMASGATGPLEPKQVDYLTDIHVSARHLLSLINDILDLAKLEAGQLTLSRDVLAVPAVLERVAAAAAPPAAVRGISLDVTVEPGAEFVVGDHYRLEQVLLNLTSNAVKFTPDGGRVALRAVRSGDELVVSVRDTGIGIPPEQRQRIFEAFSQGRQRTDGTPEGTGLGLSLVKGLVELHGGRITVDSQPDRGSDFTVVLPGVTSPQVPVMRGAS